MNFSAAHNQSLTQKYLKNYFAQNKDSVIPSHSFWSGSQYTIVGIITLFNWNLLLNKTFVEGNNQPIFNDCCDSINYMHFEKKIIIVYF